MSKIKNKTHLHTVLYKEQFDAIVFWEKNGKLIWNNVQSSFQCCISCDGNRLYPFARINRTATYNSTHQQINDLLEYIENKDQYEEY